MVEQVTSGLRPDVLPPQVRFTAVAREDGRKRNTLAIRHVSGDEVVAVVEVVSSGNKDRQHSLTAFVDKAIELLDAGVHLLILDLHPPGEHDPKGVHAAIWLKISKDDFEPPADKPLTL